MPKPVNLTVLRARMRTQLASKRQGDFLRSLTLADPLTALLNRRAFDETILEEWRRCRDSHVAFGHDSGRPGSLQSLQ